MNKSTGIICLILLTLLIAPAAAATLYVDDNGGEGIYTTIGEAITAAADGDCIVVRDGAYTENVQVDKQLCIRSENGASAVTVTAAAATKPVFNLAANGVTIEGFTVCGPGDWGAIEIVGFNDCIVRKNDCSGCYNGIHLGGAATNNTIEENYCHENDKRGLSVRDTANANLLVNNTCEKNAEDEICIKDAAKNNVIWANAFNGTVELRTANIYHSSAEVAYTYGSKAFTGYVGNYYSRYTGADADTNGIGDTPMSFGTYKDEYPMMGLWRNGEITGGPTTPVGPTTRYVDASGGTAYATINDAVAASNPGDTIIVKDGAYTENVQVDKDLVIRSENGASAVTVTAAAATKPVFNLAANGVKVEGFTVCGPSDWGGVEIVGFNDCTVRKNDVSGCYNGIHLGGAATNNTVDENYCHENDKRGLSVRDTANVNLLVNNICEKNGEDEICIKDAAKNNIIWANAFNGTVELRTANTYHSPEEVAYIYGSKAFTGYVGNYYTRYTGADADTNGIGDTPMSFGTYKDEYPMMGLWRNGEITGGPIGAATLYVDDDGGEGVYTTISDAVAASNAGDTVVVRDGAYTENVQVDKQLCIRSENGAGAVTVTAASPTKPVFNLAANGVTLEGFTFCGPSDWGGIEVVGFNDCTVRKNDVSGCYNGIHIGETATNNTVEENYCHENDKRGLSVRDTANANILVNNTCEKNGEDEICIKDAAKNNVIWANAFNGTVELRTANTYHSPEEVAYTYGTKACTGYVGNYYSRYTGADADTNGIGDTSMSFGTYKDDYPMMGLWRNGEITGGPVQESKTWYVDKAGGEGVYTSIGAAVTAAAEGDIIVVRDGTYTENVQVDKQLCISSENGASTVTVTAASPTKPAFNLAADGVILEGFTVCGPSDWGGIEIVGFNDCIVRKNDCSGCYNGIHIGGNATGNTVEENYCHENNKRGLSVRDTANANILVNNTCEKNNDDEICIKDVAKNNVIWANTFNGTVELRTANTYHSPEEVAYTYGAKTFTAYVGNYYSRYTGTDADTNGIGDTPMSFGVYKDEYPMMGLWKNGTITGGKTGPTTLYVDDDGSADFTTIQAAINASAAGDIIIVRDGTYTENVYVDKELLTIKSENGSASTRVLAADPANNVFTIVRKSVNITGFTIKGANSSTAFKAGVRISASYCSVTENTCTDCMHGIQIKGKNNTVTGNNCVYCPGNGIWLDQFTGNNTVVNNTCSHSRNGIKLDYSSHNEIYLNNFVDNKYNELCGYLSASTWNTTEPITYTYRGKTFTNYLGNYYGHYTGKDAFGDGIGDTPYFARNNGGTDHAPLMGAWKDGTIESSGPLTFYVDDDGGEGVYTTISEAVREAIAGDIIIIRNGTYTENVLVDKQLCIRSENGTSAVTVTAAAASKPVFDVDADGVTVEGFTIRGPTNEHIAGIEIVGFDNGTFRKNDCSGCYNGIHLGGDATGNTVEENYCHDNTRRGISLRDSVHDNLVFNNICEQNTDDQICVKDTPKDNIIWANTFKGSVELLTANTYHSPAEVTYIYGRDTFTSYVGNYYSQYTGTDADTNGIGDTPMSFGTYKDEYPMMGSWQNGTITGGPMDPRTWYVDDDGSADFTTIQEALNEALPGDTISVLPGTYSRFNVNKPHITIMSRDGAESVIVDCQGSQGLKIPESNSYDATGTVLDDLTFLNGRPSFYLGYYGPANDSVVRNCVLEEIALQVYLKGNNLTLDDNTFMNTTGSPVSVVYLRDSTDCNVIDNTFMNITTRYGIMYLRGTATTNNIISGNTFDTGGNSFFFREAGDGNQIFLNNNVSSVGLREGTTAPNVTHWNATAPVTYTYHGVEHTGYLGNFWSNCTGEDTNDDGVINTAYELPDGLGTDHAPLMGTWQDGVISASAPELTAITLVPATAGMTVGDGQQFAATAYDQYGEEIAETEFTWTSSNTAVATVNATGYVEALTAGTATITATSGEVSGTAEVTVSTEPSELTTIVIAPATAGMTVGDGQQFTATAYDQYGEEIAETAFTWTSSNTAVATVNATGYVEAVAAGTATITAASGEVSGTAEVTVSAEPSSEFTSITLKKGWNFISVPRTLAPGTDTAAIFADVESAGHSILAFDAAAGLWKTLGENDTVSPLDGIWVYAAQSTTVELTVDPAKPVTPPTKHLSEGWNAIGFSDIEPAAAKDALISVKENWAILIGYDAESQAYEHSAINGAVGSHTDTLPMIPGKGYWLFLRADGTLAAIST
ncbi:hypothetical protein E2N92_04515 [Methanofollis formosanus]|uniref:Uncharacterized protein n=1 Tax=Methanofollis formosanus TaxID=299308 RepID=A0A8G1A137_9EURY|nr:NosD domain-containing protein [Methanofollis formosanus]QYZ78743.1 hypothetical protein E2N92_04515 [Methanofollis formosanus]